MYPVTTCTPARSPRRPTTGSPITRTAATAAVIHQRAAYFRAIDAPAAGLPLIEEALRLFEQAPPSADHAEAWLDYATIYLFHAEGRLDASLTALNRALEIAEAVGSTAVTARILPWFALIAFDRGRVDEGFSFLRQASALAEACGESQMSLWLAVDRKRCPAEDRPV